MESFSRKTPYHTLALFSHTFERRAILFDIHEAASFGISFHPLSSFRIIGLTPLPYRSNTMPISMRFVYCHNRNRIYPPNYTAGLTLSLLTLRRHPT